MPTFNNKYQDQRQQTFHTIQPVQHPNLHQHNAKKKKNLQYTHSAQVIDKIARNQKQTTEETSAILIVHVHY
jgi:hypothetical protein